MHRVLALVRASWLTAASYRFNMLVSLVSLLMMVIPVYFVAGALQPVMADSIAGQGGEYFAFLLVGIITLMFLTTAVTSLPTALGSSIASGTFEALLGTRARLGEIVVGTVGYAFIWTAVRALLLLVVGLALGAPLIGQRSPAALMILGLIILAYFPIGLLAAAGVLAFKTSGSLPAAVLTVSGLLGGVYYPTQVIPSWLQDLSAAVPLTYGLRALRAVVLEGGSLGASASDLGILAGFALVLFASSLYVFTRAVRHAKGAGTLAQY